MPTPSTTAGTTIGSRNITRSRSEKGSRELRSPSEASVPITVDSTVAPEPMIRLFTIERRQVSLVCNSTNQREEKLSIG